jgi:hypothetical protein
MCNTPVNGVHLFVNFIWKDVDFSNAAIDALASAILLPKSSPRITNEEFMFSSRMVPTNDVLATPNVNALATVMLKDCTVATAAALSVIQKDSVRHIRPLQRRTCAAVACRCRLDAVAASALR